MPTRTGRCKFHSKALGQENHALTLLDHPVAKAEPFVGKVHHLEIIQGAASFLPSKHDALQGTKSCHSLGCTRVEHTKAILLAGEVMVDGQRIGRA